MEYLSRTVHFLTNNFNNSAGVFIATALVTVFLIILGDYILRDKGVPPGPTGIPLLGYWPFLSNENCHLQQVALKKKYGDIFSFRVTGKLYINLASRKVLREAHITKSDSFMERTSEFTLLKNIFLKGIVFSNGDAWQTVRKFFLNQFRDRGMTIFKENTDEAMNETINSLIGDLRKSVDMDKPADILGILTNKSCTVIRQTLFGPNSPVTESEIVRIYEGYRTTSQLVTTSNLLLIGNIAKYLVVPFMPLHKKGFEVHKKTVDAFTKMIDYHKNTFDEHNIRGIIDSFIEERNRRKAKGDSTAEYFTDEALAGNLLQFIGDGIVNVATFITIMLKPLLDYPEEQEKIFKELVEVCGEDRNPSFADRNKLTYTNAFLLEAQRTANFIPLFPSLECTRETTVEGYRIPKGAVTVTNVYAIHNDPEEHEEPEKFNPNRFISKDGKPREESPITFGVGKRVCLGESFVLMQTFLFIAAVVKNFKLSYYRPKSDYETIRSRSQEVRVIPRK